MIYIKLLQLSPALKVGEVRYQFRDQLRLGKLSEDSKLPCPDLIEPLTELWLLLSKASTLSGNVKTYLYEIESLNYSS